MEAIPFSHLPFLSPIDLAKFDTLESLTYVTDDELGTLLAKHLCKRSRGHLPTNAIGKHMILTSSSGQERVVAEILGFQDDPKLGRAEVVVLEPIGILAA